jgi:hypothetical protein
MRTRAGRRDMRKSERSIRYLFVRMIRDFDLQEEITTDASAAGRRLLLALGHTGDDVRSLGRTSSRLVS